MSSRMLSETVRSSAGRTTYRSRAAHFASAALLALVAASAPASASFVQITNLITNNTGAHNAPLSDDDLKNPWGVSFGPTSTFWVSDNHSSVATLYKVDPKTNATSKSSTVRVVIPGDGSPTGQVFNSGDKSNFNGDAFLFVSEDGTISGWRGALGGAGPAETLQLGSSANSYKGVALVSNGTNSYLLSANFLAGRIDVMKGNGNAPNLAGNFSGPMTPVGYAPFNVQTLNGHVFVTYAPREQGGIDDVKGAGNGIVDEFNLDGTFVKRVAQGGALDDPWGLAIAPKSFGALAGDLLVGNQGDGRISVFDLVTNKFMGLLKGKDGKAIEIDGLWALIVGNGTSAGNDQTVYFTAGPEDEENGLFGALSDVPEPATLSLAFGGLLAMALRRRRRTAVAA